MTDVLLVAFQVLVGLCTVAALVFVGRYATHTWWRTAMGRNLMGMALVVAALFGMTLLLPYLDVSDLVKAALADLAVLGMLYVLVKRIRLLAQSDRAARLTNDAEEL